MEEQTTARSDIQAAIEAGQSLGGAMEAGEREGAYAIVPAGARLESLENLQGAPDYTRAERRLTDLASFLAYLNRFADSESTVYADPDQSRLVAILDHPIETDPRWGAHRAVYGCPLSRSWQAWIQNNGEWMGQADFAQHIEDNLPDILIPSDVQDAPSGADMLEIARTLEAKREANYKSGVRLDNGDFQIAYQEETTGSAGPNGQLEIPETFYLGLPVYKGGDHYKVSTQLQYRIRDGVLKLRYRMYRPEDIQDEAFDGVVDTVRQRTQAHVLLGRP